MLESKLNARLQKQLNDSILYSEFHALFGETKELMITKSTMFDEEKKDTVLFVY